MKKNTARRFSAIELTYHWGQAIPYIVLFCTGGMDLLQRLLAIELIPHESLSSVHRVAGIVLIIVLGEVVLLSLFTGGFRKQFGTLRDALSWGAADAIWLTKLPLNTVWRRISLPPVGRLNPGQKLNVLFVVVLVLGFTGTGLGMMLIPGALMPWIIHVALLLPAGVLLVAHLFLALINPPTRKALRGIFTGFVSSEYMASHHPLIAGEGKVDDPHPHVSWRAATATAVLIAFVAAGIVSAYGPVHTRNRILTLWDRRGVDAILPGGLCASHGKDPKANRCTACHRMFNPPPSSACLSCHKEIAKVVDKQIGFHGALTGECRSCHADHIGDSGDVRRLDTEAFNHNLARFPLKGKHQELSCSKCHLREGPEGINERTRYLDLRFAKCIDCHPDPHGGQFEKTCDQCHSEDGWKDRWVVDAHGQGTRYPLLGKHVAVECVKCHPREGPEGTNGPIRYVALRFGTCRDCHPDPHGGQFEETCDQCHSENGWKDRWVVDAHGRGARYPLLGKHAAVECVKCHPLSTKAGKFAGARFSDTPTQCKQCHEDPHQAQLQATCETCHTEMGWKGRDLVFAHDRDSEFAIDGIHSGLSCSSCHPGEAKTIVYRPLPKNCEGCHTDVEKALQGMTATITGKQDPHAGRVPCTKCHLIDIPSPTAAAYARACATCHNEHYEGLFYEWLRSLHERESRAQRMIETISQRNPAQSEELQIKIEEAKTIGLHNVLFARTLWDKILEASSDGDF
jgi:cytochrome b subunit of formate dehydrogenase